jgi:hypothetical protein
MIPFRFGRRRGPASASSPVGGGGVTGLNIAAGIAGIELVYGRGQ